MRINQEQRLPYSKKDKQWRVNEVDYLCSRADEFSYDWIRIWQNYRLLNNQLDQEEYRQYCDTLGLDKSDGKKFVEPFNKSHNIINVLRGEEGQRPWNFSVINLNPNTTNNIIRKKDRAVRDYVDQLLQLEVEYELKKAQTNAMMQAGDIDPKQAEKLMQEAQKQLEKSEENLTTPEKIKATFANYKSGKEITMHKLLKAMVVNQNLKYIKNETFTDALCAGIEAVHLKVDGADINAIPKIKQVNPLTLFFHKSPDSPFIQDGDYAGYKEELTIGETLDMYGDKMHSKDRERLYTFRNKIYGTDTPFSSKDGKSQSSWTALKNFEYGYNGGLGVPYYSSNNVLADGLYNSRLNGRYYDDYCVVYTCFWKSQRKVGVYKYQDEYGKMQQTVVSEEFIIPKGAKRESYRQSLLNRSRTRFYWYDENDVYHSLEWIWVPEVWRGTRINGDIYVDIEPVEWGHQSLLNPYDVKLPIYGYVYNSRNAQTISVMDRIKPWQKLYYVVMSKWLKLITQDKGVINLLNVLMMDKDIGYEKSLQFAVDQGMLPYNPLSHSQGHAIGNTFKAAERLDLSNSQQLSHYTQILQFIENQLNLAAGISPQRLAQTSTNTNVTDNQRDTAHSMNITESVFSAHDVLWEKILQGLMEVSTTVFDSKSGFLREIMNDQEIAIMDLGLISLEDEYSIKVANNTKAYRDLEMSKGYIQALVQNDKASFSTLLGLLTTDNIEEFKRELQHIEVNIEQRQQQAEERQQKAQQDHLEKLKQMEIEAREDEQAHELEIKKLENETKIRQAEINAFRFQQDQDINNNRIPDQLEIERLKRQAIDAKEQVQLEREKLEYQKEKDNIDATQRERDRQSKERIEKEKANVQKAKQNQKA